MKRSSLWKGLAAGFSAGFTASWVMGQAHRLILKSIGQGESQPMQEDPTVKVARTISSCILQHRLTADEADQAGPLVHYLFGASMAALYASVAEYSPSVTAGEGVLFGAALWLGAHVIAVPALRLAPPLTKSTAPSEIAEFLAHLSYGGWTELVRSQLRRLPRR